jgi:hypothetical protein
MTASGSVSDYSDTSSLQENIANIAGLDTSHVTIEVAAASVIITATLAVPASTTVLSVQEKLTRVLGTAAAASQALGLTVEGVPTVEIPPLPRPTPNPGGRKKRHGPSPSATPLLPVDEDGEPASSCELPAAPRSFEVVPGSAGCGSFNISWVMADQGEACDAGSYVLRLWLRSEEGSTTQRRFELTEEELSPVACLETCVMDITGLAPGTTASLALQAVNARGVGDETSLLNVTTSQSLQCPPPSLSSSPAASPAALPEASGAVFEIKCRALMGICIYWISRHVVFGKRCKTVP